MKEAWNKLFELLGAFEAKARFVIALLFLAVIGVPYIMFNYFDVQIKECKQSNINDRVRYDLNIELLRIELKKADEKTIQEIKDCQGKFISLMNEVQILKNELKPRK